MTIAFAAFFIAPLLVIVPISFTAGQYVELPIEAYSLRWYARLFTSSEWSESMRHSLVVAFGATALALVLGVPAGVALARATFRRGAVLGVLVLVPLVVPTVIAAVALFRALAPLHLVGSVVGLTIAHATLCLPLVALPVAASFRTIPTQLVWQARSLGAPPWRTFVNVELPLTAASIFGAAVFAFFTSFDELVFALFLTNRNSVTLPVTIWQGLRFDLEPTTAAVATLLIGASLAVTLAVYLVRRSARQWRIQE